MVFAARPGLPRGNAVPVAHRIVTVAIVLAVLAPKTSFSADDASLALVNKASRDPVIIRAQLELGRVYAREAIERLRTAPTTQTRDRLDEAIRLVYVQFSTGGSNVRLKLQAEKTRVGIANPVLQLVASQVELATTHVRNARHLAHSFAPDRADVTAEIIARLEAALSIVSATMDLL